MACTDAEPRPGSLFGVDDQSGRVFVDLTLALRRWDRLEMHRDGAGAPGVQQEGLHPVRRNLQARPLDHGETGVHSVVDDEVRPLVAGRHRTGIPNSVETGQVGLVNWLKFQAGFREQKQSPYLQTHGAFHFLLDYVPRWQWMTKPGGLIQFQPFVPKVEGREGHVAYPRLARNPVHMLAPALAALLYLPLLVLLVECAHKLVEKPIGRWRARLNSPNAAATGR